MQKCRHCNSLVDDSLQSCPSCRRPMAAGSVLPTASPAATVALTAEQVKELSTIVCPNCGASVEIQHKSCPSCDTAIDPTQLEAPSPAAPPPPGSRTTRSIGLLDAPKPRQSTADRAQKIAWLSILPLFPIGLWAMVMGIAALGRLDPNDPSQRGQAWFAIVVGAVFGSLWGWLTVKMVVLG